MLSSPWPSTTPAKGVPPPLSSRDVGPMSTFIVRASRYITVMASRRTTDDTLRIVLIVLAVLVLAPVLMMAFAFPMMGMWGGMMGGFGGSGVSPLWSIGMLLIWLLVLLGGGYLVYRWISGSRVANSDPALEELRLAYARGEISEEEYETRRAKLGRE